MLTRQGAASECICEDPDATSCGFSMGFAGQSAANLTATLGYPYLTRGIDFTEYPSYRPFGSFNFSNLQIAVANDPLDPVPLDSPDRLFIFCFSVFNSFR